MSLWKVTVLSKVHFTSNILFKLFQNSTATASEIIPKIFFMCRYSNGIAKLLFLWKWSYLRGNNNNWMLQPPPPSFLFIFTMCFVRVCMLLLGQKDIISYLRMPLVHLSCIKIFELYSTDVTETNWNCWMENGQGPIVNVYFSKLDVF